jgi:hypothetical protein
LPKRKIKEEKPKRRLGKKEMLIPPIAMGGAMLLALVIVPQFLPPPRPIDVCLKGTDIESFQLFPKIEMSVDGHTKYLPDDVGRQPMKNHDCVRAIRTDKVSDEIHIEYIRPVRLTMDDFMKVYSYDNKTITVIDNSTGTNEKQVLQLDQYDVKYSYFAGDNPNCDGTQADADCYTYPAKLSDFPPFTKDMLARIEMTSKQ